MTSIAPSAASAAPHTDREFVAARNAAVFAERVRLLYRLSRPGYPATLGVAALIALALWPLTPQLPLLMWCGLVSVITAARFVLFRRFVLRDPPAQEMAKWRRYFVGGAAAMGCAWGLLGSALLPAGEFLHQLLVTFLILGVVAVALVLQTPVRLAFYSFAGTALLPLIATMLAQGDRIYLYAGLMLLVFFGVIIGIAPVMHRKHLDPLRSRFENEALVLQLSAANRELSGRIEEQRVVEAELQRSSARLDALIDASPLAIIVRSEDGTVSRWSRAAERIFGWSEQEVVGRPVPAVPADKTEEKMQFRERIRRGEEFLDVEAVRQRKDGRRIAVSMSAAPLFDADGRTAGIVMIVADVSERKRAEQLQLLEHTITRMLSESQSIEEAMGEVMRKFCEIADWSYGARWVLNVHDQKLTCLEIWHVESPAIAVFAELNRQAHRDYRPRSGGLLRGVWESGEPVWMEDAAADATLTRASEIARAGLRAAIAFPVLILGKFYGVMEFFATDARPRDEGLIRVARAIGGQIGQFIARKEAELHLTFFANHDALTGLPNRTMFGERLAQALARAQRNERMLAMLFIDLDRFKVINDTLGHDAGDRLLQQVATRLRGCLREGDTIARQGGDEFVVLVEDMTDTIQATGVAQKILEAFGQSYVLSEQELHVTVSIGVSVYPEDGSDAQSLLKNADIALYRAKDAGKNTFRFYSAQTNVHSLDRLALETDLRRALERGELRLHYQPKIDTRSGCIAGVEALLRWQHPVRGAVAPAEVIALAEETGLIVAIGDWVIRTACRDARQWEARGLPAISVAVNLSARQFGRDDLADAVGQILQESGLAATRLELEITESAVMENAERAAVVLDRLHGMGVRVALDDFGTGYSSLGYLKRFRVDSVKIDRSFIADIPDDEDDVAITRAVIAMAHSLRLTVVAEGVETADQVRFLRDHGCDEMQGYYFAKPCDVTALEALLAVPLRTAG